MKELKKQLRKQIKEEKSRQSNELLVRKSSALLEHIEQHPRFIAAKTVLLYHSLSDEVRTHDFVEKWYPHKRILLPVVKGEDLELRLYTGKDSLQLGAFQIEEPIGSTFTDYAAIELAIIPGVAFDRKGNRLGRGKGYYDRLLPRLSSYNIGICFQFQALEEIPAEAFDQPMNEVWTEDGKIYPPCEGG